MLIARRSKLGLGHLEPVLSSNPYRSAAPCRGVTPPECVTPHGEVGPGHSRRPKRLQQEAPVYLGLHTPPLYAIHGIQKPLNGFHRGVPRVEGTSGRGVGRAEGMSSIVISSARLGSSRGRLMLKTCTTQQHDIPDGGLVSYSVLTRKTKNR